MATEYHLITQNGTSGTYWASLTTEQKSRYLIAGSSYRVYATWNAFVVAFNTATADLSKDIVCEVEGAWTDTSTAATIGANKCNSLTVTTRINGVYGSGYHGGVYGAGYIRQNGTSAAALYTTQHNTTFDGLQSKNTSTGAGVSAASCIACVVDNCICESTGGTAVSLATPASLARNVIACNSVIAFAMPTYANSYTSAFVNCIAVGNTNGFIGATGSGAAILNCISAGNSTNWGTSSIPTGFLGNNAGELGDTPWGSNSVTVASTDFVNYVVPVTSASNFSPALATSPQVNSGTGYRAPAYDLAGKYRPDYESATHPNNVWDIGPFEYDHGEGNTPPASCTLTISAPVSLVGAEIRIYDNDNSPAGSFGTELSGVESHTSSTYSYTGLQGNSIVIQIMQTGYEEFVQTYTVPATATVDFYARMTADTNA